ncbi:GTP-binding protein 10 homolog [Venturia canescens]|uniref:GTP-binding protein 10 homolog n=1 Tax=Venturia canescens TaxID=32260 RepID=UPI001C9C1A4F|nr:GTP-binding protein 10 homolog [Venturia canescens]
MVFLTNCLGYVIKKVPRKYLRSGFMDSLRIHVKAGSGGMGLPRYGGIGGRGGHVYIVTNEKVTLEMLTAKARKTKFFAGHGGSSTSSGLIGLEGKDLCIEAPLGISVYSEDGALLGDLNSTGAKLKIAAGGIGGCPETGFSGQKGQAHCIQLDLKLIADVGLVGFPNAGKSTLLRAVSQAKPKIASYPFTTMRPHLGTVIYPDLRTITVADLPGLIEGAHANIGMGHKFLKHLSRTKLLVFMVDVQGFQLSVKHGKRSCLETVILLNKEVELYKPDLLKTPAILIVNKMDTENASNIYSEIEPSLKNLSTVLENYPEEMRPETVLKFEEIITTSMSLKKTEDVEKVKNCIRNVLDSYYERQAEKLSGSKELKLIDRFKREMRQKAPVLV